MRNGHVAMRGQVLLTKSPKSVWEREKERGREQTERERDLFRERSSTFSLKFPAIRPSDSGEVRSKVAPHGKDYGWIPVLGSFHKLRNGRVFFSYLLYFLLKGYVMDRDLLRPGWPWFRFQKLLIELRNP